MVYGRGIVLTKLNGTMFVSDEEKNRRLEICGNCKHFGSYRQGFCGKPVIGNKVKKGRGEVRLCGCYMPAKVTLKWARCPLGKWKSEVDEKFIKEAEDFLEKYDRDPSRVNNREFYNVFNAIRGGKAVKDCLPCIKDDIKKLRKVVKQYRNEE